MKDVNLACGIDTLYYFAETNKNYDNVFIDILSQMENKKGFFERQEIEYKNSNIFIEINNMPLQYLNKAEGFYWFKDINEYFRIGFKDEKTNLRLHNIRVQLQGIGIYSIGMKSLLSIINNNLLEDIATGLFLITRADINCFVNYDLSYVDRTMFATRKNKYHTISEHGTSTKTQTIYVGKPPFMLRLYNKKLELKKSSKKSLMSEHFKINGLDTNEHIFNVEFEMHRPHLKAYEINTLDDLLTNANMLFKKAMQDIRLIDNSNITDKDIKNNSRNRASSLPIWEYIKNNFDIKEFLQSVSPLQRVQKEEYIYTLDKFVEEIHIILQKGITHSVGVSPDLLSDITDEYLLKIEKINERRRKQNAPKKKYIPVTIHNDENEYRLLNNGEFIKPAKVIPYNQLSDTALINEIVKLESEFYFEDRIDKEQIAQKIEIANREKSRRGVK